LQERFPDLHEMLVDAYENQMMTIAPPTERDEE
jgi:hypothetical protein